MALPWWVSAGTPIRSLAKRCWARVTHSVRRREAAAAVRAVDVARIKRLGNPITEAIPLPSELARVALVTPEGLPPDVIFQVTGNCIPSLE